LDPSDLFLFIAIAATTGSLRLISSTATGGNLFLFQRAGYAIGDAVTIQYDAGHVGDDVMSFTPPAVTWLKDGAPVSHTPRNTVGDNGGLSTTLSFTLRERDAGVYLCVFSDTTRAEIFVAEPIRLDTGKGSLYHRHSHAHCVLLLLLGETMTIQAISPSVIGLRPPQKLVIEVMVTGQYLAIQWARNGSIRGIPGGPFSPPEESFTYFGEVYFVEVTTEEDLGRYEVDLHRGHRTTKIPIDVMSIGTTT
jgi:hypothetical protein